MNHVDPSGHLVETIVDIGSVGYSIYVFAKDPSWENAGWLALDVGGAIVPFVPSGTTIKGGGAAVKAIKNSKLVVKITDYASIVKKKVGAVISFGKKQFANLKKAVRQYILIILFWIILEREVL